MRTMSLIKLIIVVGAAESIVRYITNACVQVSTAKYEAMKED